jgi:hypothetical protein
VIGYELDGREGGIFLSGALDVSLLCSVQNVPEPHPASYPTGIEGYFS